MATTPPNAVVGTLRALADPVRLRLLHLLAGREVCVGDLVAALRLPQPSVSRHLAALRQAGLVAVRRDGLWCHYTLAAPPGGPLGAQVRPLLAACAAGWPTLAEDCARLAALRAAGGCCPVENLGGVDVEVADRRGSGEVRRRRPQ
jgi:ArsR family transcriptional regulator